MLISPFNRAILSLRETVGGIDKLQKLDVETEQQYIERRKLYIEKIKRSQALKKKGK